MKDLVVTSRSYLLTTMATLYLPADHALYGIKLRRTLASLKPQPSSSEPLSLVGSRLQHHSKWLPIHLVLIILLSIKQFEWVAACEYPFPERMNGLWCRHHVTPSTQLHDGHDKKTLRRSIKYDKPALAPRYFTILTESRGYVEVLVLVQWISSRRSYQSYTHDGHTKDISWMRR